MKYQGRTVDAVKFWENYVSFPSSLNVNDTFSPLVQCPNPEHNTHKFHFQVNLKEPMCHCFAECGISGSWEHAVCVIEGLYDKFKVDPEKLKAAWRKKAHERTADERDQIRKQFRARKQAQKIILRSATSLQSASGGVVAKKRKSKSGHSSKPTHALSPDSLQYATFLPQLALEYLEQRGISEDSIARWSIGWDQEERRIVIPARDLDGRTRFLIKRAVRPDDYPKYLYSEGYPKTTLLFGACEIQPGMLRSGGLVIVEGSLDVIRLHQHGLKNAVAILGTGISVQQRNVIEKLNPPRIYNFFDKDLSGMQNIEKASVMLRKYPQYVVKFPKGKSDPAELTREEAYRQISRSVPLTRFLSTIH